jgi:hypothetical protein
MSNKKTAFFIRAYNDLDHFSPIIWKFIREKSKPIVVFHAKLDFVNDYRIKILKEAGEFEIYRFLDKEYVKYQKSGKGIIFKLFKKLYNLKRNPDKFFGKVHRGLFFDCSIEIGFLKKNNVGQCVFEWSTPYSRGEVIEKFFKAAKSTGITTISVPHGCNIYTHPDVNIGYRNLSKKGKIVDASRRNEYDYYIFQNPIRRDGWVKWGYDPLKTQAWGSGRFYPEWQKINLENCPKLNIKKEPGSRLKVVFMDHQKDYNVYVDKIWSLLNRIAENDQTFLVIKQSTRAGKDYHSKAFRTKYGNANNVEFVGNENHSPRLIEWSDCVINFGSSIGMEVLLQNKSLINPHYLHSNRTLFDKFDTALNAECEDEVMNYLKQIAKGDLDEDPVESKEIIYREIIFGGKDEHDVLQSYYDNITANYLNY